MLQSDFALPIILFLILIVLIIKMVAPIYRFIKRAQDAIYLYSICEPYINNETHCKKTIEEDEFNEVHCGNYKLIFIGEKELLIELDEIMKDALWHYDKLSPNVIATGQLTKYKDQLIDICCKVRYRKWQKYGL